MTRTAKRWIQGTIALVALIAAFTIGFLLRGESAQHQDAASATTQAATTWTCSMHPQIHLPNPGQCPICGMDLIPLVKQESGNDGPRTLTLSDAAASLAEIQTTKVIRRPVDATLRMVGKLEADESRVREISAWVDGRIERLYVDYTGIRVQAGQNLFELYSPALFSAQEELLQAIKAADELNRSNLGSSRRSAARTIEASRERLRLWGLTPQQIEDIERRGTAAENINIVAPMSGTVLHKDAFAGAYVKTGKHVYTIADLSLLWLKLDVFEADISWIAEGQQVRFTTDAFAGEQFEGTVSFIDPVVDQRSRSVKVRVNVQNESGRLKPGMFARAIVHASVKANGDGPPMVIPKTATLVTGKRAVVYVADPENRGQYHGREVVLGPEAGDVIVVLEGLQVGEYVVSNGSFKIDSALQILAKTSMMNPTGGGASPGHHPGDMQAASTSADPSAIEPVAAIPDAFRAQLDELLKLYLQVSKALSQDNLGAAQSASALLPAAVQVPQHGLLPAAGQQPWGELQTRLAQAANAVAQAPSLEAARVAFYDLSASVTTSVRLFGASGSRAIFVYHCPMARDGAGADWLQDFDDTENPYFGSKMLRCGDKTETLAAESHQQSLPAHENH